MTIGTYTYIDNAKTAFPRLYFEDITSVLYVSLSGSGSGATKVRKKEEDHDQDQYHKPTLQQ
jgi:hypothetical protein